MIFPNKLSWQIQKVMFKCENLIKETKTHMTPPLFFPIKSFFLAVKVTGKKQQSKNQTE